ncbi:MAG: dioxygenase [Cyanobium sp.]
MPPTTGPSAWSTRKRQHWSCRSEPWLCDRRRRGSGGFDQALYAIQDLAPGSAQNAREVAAALEAAGVPVRTDVQRGLDHGAWVPLRYQVPPADVLVFPSPMQHHGGPGHAWRTGQALAPLAKQGRLISGNTVTLLDYRQNPSDALTGPSPR